MRIATAMISHKTAEERNDSLVKEPRIHIRKKSVKLLEATKFR